MCCSDRSGYSLFEVMIVLSMLALVTAVGVSRFRPPSPELVLQREAAHVAEEAARLRLLALQSQRDQVLDVEETCEGRTQLVFFADGTARATTICLERSGVTKMLYIEPLTGRIARQ